MMRRVLLCVLLASSTSATDEQDLCDILVKKYNAFVDMVPLAVSMTFPSNNDFFVGSSEVIFYGAEDTSYSPKCTVLYDKGITMLRVDVFMRIVILNQGSRMEISKCELDAHLRLQKDDTHLFVDPLLVDVQVPGDVYQDGVLLDQKQAEEILRPTLIKGFTSLASKYLSYSGSRSQAYFVDAEAAAYLFKQLVMSYISQIVR